MKYLYVGLCLLTLAATFRFAKDLSQSLAAQKGSANVALATLSTEATRIGTGSTTVKVFPKSQPSDTTEHRFPQLVSPTQDLSKQIVESEIAEPGATSSIESIKQFSPMRHRAALHKTMITPGNFEYLGAIRPPHIEQNGTTFAYGGWGIAYRSDGDPDGPDDGFPGSLFIVGHMHHQKVAEISIPAPVNSKLKLADDLPVARILQPFCDITNGMLEAMTAGESEQFQLGGLLVTNGVLHWTTHKYYNVANRDFLSHGRSGLDMQTSVAEGLWHLGPMNSGRPEWNSYKHAGYIFEIPPVEATQWFGGRNLISGLQISTGLQASSQGPSMFAYSLPPEGTPSGVSLDAVPLAWYAEQQPLERHHPADRWIGGAWLTLGEKQAVVIAGRKALGDYYYGEPRPHDCYPYKGYHGPPYEVEFLFYSPASLVHAANGSLPATAIKPWLRWSGESEGGGLNQYMFDTCGKDIGGLTFDRDRNLLYLVQIDAGKTSDNEYEPLPVVHVFRIVE